LVGGAWCASLLGDAARAVESEKVSGLSMKRSLLAPMTSISGEETNQKSIQQGKGAKKYE